MDFHVVTVVCALQGWNKLVKILPFGAQFSLQKMGPRQEMKMVRREEGAKGVSGEKRGREDRK